ncbi:hypothetical protein WMY93_002315 [Mugilogobius chulae]|uniref:Uncharacterized protein n=1 Tax=Mugilogobius chulae TaxID=88201 RepID=A0AAW0PWE1_9GOBI
MELMKYSGPPVFDSDGSAGLVHHSPLSLMYFIKSALAKLMRLDQPRTAFDPQSLSCSSVHSKANAIAIHRFVTGYAYMHTKHHYLISGVIDRSQDTAFEAGVRVQIHSQAEPPFVHELGFGVAPGFQTFVATQEQRLTYLPPPWGECEWRALESGFFEVYSVTACRIDCETRYIVENCNCRMVHMPGEFQHAKEAAEPVAAAGLQTSIANMSHQPYLELYGDCAGAGLDVV